MRVRTKLTLTMVLIAFMVAAAALVTGFAMQRKELLREFRLLVQSISGTASIPLSGEEIEAIRNNADANSPEFLSLSAIHKPRVLRSI